jgi:hypothetical protein
MEMMSEKHELPRWLDLRPIGLIALAGALVWSTSIVMGTWHSVRVKTEARSIKITGSAKRRITSDLIQWEAVLEARAPDRTAAYKQLKEETDKAVAFLVAQGIKPDEIRPSSASFEEDVEVTQETKVLPNTTVPITTEKRVFKGYITHQSITVQSGDVPRIEKASREVTSLLEDGVTISSGAPRYFYTHLGELKVEMLAAAGKDARARADNILKSAGGADIGKLIVADMGIININPANSTQTSEEGNNDTSSYEKDIITIVHAELELD